MILSKELFNTERNRRGLWEGVQSFKGSLWEVTKVKQIFSF